MWNTPLAPLGGTTHMLQDSAHVLPCDMTVCLSRVAGLAHSLRVLYLDASSSKYVGSADKKHMLDQLCASLTRLPVDSCICVLQVRMLAYGQKQIGIV